MRAAGFADSSIWESLRPSPTAINFHLDVIKLEYIFIPED